MLERLIDEEVRLFERLKPLKRTNPTFIPIHLTGGIGDIIMAIDAIKVLQKDYQIVVYTHHLEAFKYFYRQEVPAFKIKPDFAWDLEFNTIAKIHKYDEFSGFLVKAHQDLFERQLEVLNREPKLENLVRSHFKKFFLISLYSEEINCDRRQFPMHCLGYKDGSFFETFERQKPEKYITIHDGFDIHNQNIVSGRATKQWKWDHWNKLVRDLKKKYPDYRIIQLGALTAREIDGTECLVNKTSIIEAFDILSKSSLHIDGDSGLSHAATKMSVPGVVLWGPTPAHFYGYKQNVNLEKSPCSYACYGVKDNWNDKCVAGYSNPKCMDQILPEQVMSSIEERELL